MKEKHIKVVEAEGTPVGAGDTLESSSAFQRRSARRWRVKRGRGYQKVVGLGPRAGTG